MKNLTLDRNFQRLTEIKKNNNVKKRIYGYKNFDSRIVAISCKEDDYCAIVDSQGIVLSTKNEIPGYVKNIIALFNKFPLINYIIIEKKEQITIDKEQAIKINEKIKNYIIDHIRENSGKIEIPENKTIIYYSVNIEDL